MNAEEAKFHQKWYKIFLDIDRNTVGGIGFDPKSVPQYTPQNVAEFMKLYKYKKRLTFSPVLKGAIKTAYTTFIWGLVATGIGSFGVHKYFQMHLDDLHEEEAALTKELEEAKNRLSSKDEIAKRRSQNHRELAIAFEKNRNDLNICEQKVKVLGDYMTERINKQKTESDKICSKNQVHAVDVIRENIVYTTTFSKGVPYKCKVLFNERVPRTLDGCSIEKMKRRSGTNFTLHSGCWATKTLRAYKAMGITPE